MRDLVFTKNFFGFVIDKKKAFRNYLKIISPEIVNMPFLGFDLELINFINFNFDKKTEVTINTITKQAEDYNIIVKSYTKFFIEVDSTIVFENIVLA